jgi:hypothetical protein
MIHIILRFHSDASEESALSINMLGLVDKPCFSQMLVRQSEDLMPQFIPDFFNIDHMLDCRKIASAH